MGNGTLSAKRMLRVIKDAFAASPYEVYIASAYLNKTALANIHVAPRWDFEQLLDEAVLFINHGGQNSISSGLIHGVPQIFHFWINLEVAYSFWIWRSKVSGYGRQTGSNVDIRK